MLRGGPSPLVLSDPMRVALLGGELVANRLRARPGLRLILPGGQTPPDVYAVLRAHAIDGSLFTGRATMFQLPERSDREVLERELAGIRFGAVEHIDAAASGRSPLDLAVLGIDRGGHLPVDPQSLAGARELLVLVSGRGRAAALRDMLEGEPRPACPASLLRDHLRLTVICDSGAASLLRPGAGWSSDRTVIVLGHREPSVSPEHRISAESHARLRRAERDCRRDPPRAVILTGFSRTGGVSEAEQMHADWRLPEVPVLLEDAGRNTAENASRSLPIIRAIGTIRRVTVVTSAWHFRTPYFFAPYRLFGLRLSFRVTAHGHWPRMLQHEFRELGAARRERRQAMAEMRLPPEPAR